MGVGAVTRRRGRGGGRVERRREKREDPLGVFIVLVVRGRQAARLLMVETRHQNPRPHSSR